jgi:hypothetical protein
MVAIEDNDDDVDVYVDDTHGIKLFKYIEEVQYASLELTTSSIYSIALLIKILYHNTVIIKEDSIFIIYIINNNK